MKGQIESPPILFEVTDGKYREVGWGSYETRVESGIVTSLQVDWYDRPANYNTEDHREVWLTKDNTNYRVGNEGAITKTGKDAFFISNRNRQTRFDSGTISTIVFPENLIAQFPNGKGDCILGEYNSQSFEQMTHIYYRGKYRRIHASLLQGEFNNITSVSWKSESVFIATVSKLNETKSYMVQLLN